MAARADAANENAGIAPGVFLFLAFAPSRDDVKRRYQAARSRSTVCRMPPLLT